MLLIPNSRNVKYDWYLIGILNEQLVMRNHIGGLKEPWQQIEGNYVFEVRN